MHLGDSWYFVDKDIVHAFYLVCPDTVERHTAWDIGHAVSSNLVDWYDHHIVLERGANTQWDDTCLATGSILYHDNRYWMAYTAKWNKPDVAVGLAVSDDLYTWEKCEWNPISQIEERFYEKIGSGQRNFSHWRDPQLFKRDDFIYHTVCASKNTGPTDARGTVGLARTKNMKDWEVVEPFNVEESVQELECPQFLVEKDKFIILFSSFYNLFSDELKKEKDPETLRQSSYCMWSEKFEGPYRFEKKEPIIPKNYPVQPYAMQLVRFKGKSYLMGTVWDFEGNEDFLSDPIEIKFDGTSYKVIS